MGRKVKGETRLHQWRLNDLGNAYPSCISGPRSDRPGSTADIDIPNCHVVATVGTGHRSAVPWARNDDGGGPPARGAASNNRGLLTPWGAQLFSSRCESCDTPPAPLCGLLGASHRPISSILCRVAAKSASVWRWTNYTTAVVLGRKVAGKPGKGLPSTVPALPSEDRAGGRAFLFVVTDREWALLWDLAVGTSRDLP